MGVRGEWRAGAPQSAPSACDVNVDRDSQPDEGRERSRLRRRSGGCQRKTRSRRKREERLEQLLGGGDVATTGMGRVCVEARVAEARAVEAEEVKTEERLAFDGWSSSV